jgi:asparagine synthase (glutamine-hydrolysing)
VGENSVPLILEGDGQPAERHRARQADANASASSLCIGHRRLSIVDLSPAGHQPMASDDSRLWITYNGEIYNYVELREELRALGHSFASQSDTEVILAAYRQWGKACLARFNGMFAFILVDRATQTLFAARDRFGVKPLYFWVSPAGLLAFASEIKQFTVLPGWSPRLNGQRAYDFLNWGVLDHTVETLFDSVFQLRGGEACEVPVAQLPVSSPSRTRPAVYRWYELEPRPFSGTLDDAARAFKGLLTDAVRLRLRADVPVGSCLSGGLDSSSIVCVMNQLLREQEARSMQKTFSAGSSVKRFDERAFAQEVTQFTATDAHYVVPGPDGLFATLDEMSWHQDEPFGSSSIYAQWCVFRLAAQHGIKVMLDGQGADEQLAGYDNYYAARLGNLFRGLRWSALWREMAATRSVRGFTYLWSAKQLLNNVLPEFVRQPLRRLTGYSDTNPPWLDLRALGAEPRDPYLAGGLARARSVRDMSAAQITSGTLQMLLHWEDRNSMAHSIEARVPFLDYRLVEFVLGLPDHHKISAGTTKRVLREAMQGALPERVRMRADKLGFVTPEEVWLREDRPDQFRAALAQSVSLAGGIIKPGITHALERMIAGRERFGFLIWRCISFGSWLKSYGVRI